MVAGVLLLKGHGVMNELSEKCQMEKLSNADIGEDLNQIFFWWATVDGEYGSHIYRTLYESTYWQDMGL